MFPFNSFIFVPLSSLSSKKTEKKRKKKQQTHSPAKVWLELLHSFRLKTWKIPYKIEREKGIYDKMCVCMRELDSRLRSAHEREHVLKAKKNTKCSKEKRAKGSSHFHTHCPFTLCSEWIYTIFNESSWTYKYIHIIHIWLQERSIFEPNTRCFYSYIQAIMYVATKRSTVVAAAAACLCAHCIYPFLTRTRDERSCVCSKERNPKWGTVAPKSTKIQCVYE